MSLLSDRNQRKADNDSEHEYLEHVALRKRLHRIGRNQVFDRVEDAGHLGRLDIGSCHLKMDSLSEADQSWNDNADCTCNRGGAQEENHRVAGDLTCRFCISDAADAHDN